MSGIGTVACSSGSTRALEHLGTRAAHFGFVGSFRAAPGEATRGPPCLFSSDTSAVNSFLSWLLSSSPRLLKDTVRTLGSLQRLAFLPCSPRFRQPTLRACLWILRLAAEPAVIAEALE